MRLAGTTLNFNLRVRVSQCRGLERSQPPLHRREPHGELLDAGRIGPAQFVDRLGEASRRLLAAPRHPLARVLATANDVVEQILGALTGLLGGIGGRRQGPLDGGSQRVADPLALGIGRGAPLAVGTFAHAAILFSPFDPPMPFHLRPSAPTAADAIICGDPGRALTIAQSVMVQPRMSNHHRGLWGYWGETEAGTELTVQATGIGGPSAVTVLTELAELGLRRVIRVGTCAAGGAAALGSTLVVAAAVAADGASAALGAPPGAAVIPDPELTTALEAASRAPAVAVVSGDLQPAADTEDPRPTDLQTAATLTWCSRNGIAAAAGLVVARADGRRLEDEPLDAELLRLARAAAQVLGG